ncbi:MAG: glycosyltransferase family 2 protein [Algicola sp.]|nr:glycosyltransferase family 2 protein [Algicola sp.]
MLEILALFIGFLIVYHHALYPLLLRLLASRQSDVQVSHCLADAELPTINLILPAYNEAGVVAAKIRNVAALNYPADKLKITLIGDGCTDDTMAIATAVAQEPCCAGLSLKIEEHINNRGKVAVINQAVKDSKSDIVALSDISALINVDGLRMAARRFQQANVGVVSSTYQFANYSSSGEEAYWRYQSKVKLMETRTGSVIGAHGALYFFRRELFRPLKADTINDDFILPMRIVEQGYKAVHEASITATELECVKPVANNNRRMRIGAGNLQQAIRLRRLLSPAFKGVAFNFLSGKVLRVLMPVCLLLFMVVCVLLAEKHLIFALLTAGQTLFYILALFVHFTNREQNREQSGEQSTQDSKPRNKPNRLLAVIYYFASGYWYSLIGMVQYLSKSRTFKV